MVAFPTSIDLASFTVMLVVGIPLVYVISRVLKLRAESIQIGEKRKQVIASLVLFLVVFVIAFAILAVYAYVWVRQNLEEDLVYVFRDAIWIAAILIPVFAIMKLKGQSLRSVGISRSGLGKNLAFGLIVSAIFTGVLAFLAPSLGGGDFTGISLPTVYSLISLVLIGFGEEIIFRGYIQTRLTAYSSAIIGIILSAVLFAIFSFSSGYFCYSGDVRAASFYALWRFSPGVVFSYMFHRSKNVIPSSIFHTLFVWGALLFRLYF